MINEQGRMYGISHNPDCHPADVTPPKSQLRTDLTSGDDWSIKNVVAADARKVIATPDNTNVVVDITPPTRANPYEINIAEIAPVNAIGGSIFTPFMVLGIGDMITIVAARPAPEATPMRYGSARGLRKIP